MPDLSQVFNLSLWDLAIIFFRTAAIYFALLILLRLAGKRELGQMTPFDFIVILTISNAVQNAMVGPDNSLTGGIVAAATLIVINAVINRTALRYRLLGRNLAGTPTLLINNGKFIPEHLAREGIQEWEVEMAMREHGIGNVSQVQMAVLEVDGSISIVPVEDGVVHRTRRKFKTRRNVV